MTGFVKTGLIAGVRNCSYSPFSRQSQFLSIFFKKKMTLLLYVRTIIIPESSLKAKNKLLTYLGLGTYCHDTELC